MKDEKILQDELMSDEELEKVSGGSIWFTEEEVKKAGLKLLKEDGSPGVYHWYWNEGDYYWNDEKVSTSQANAIANFVAKKGYQPKSVNEAVVFNIGQNGII